MNTTVQWARKIHKDHTLRQRLYRLPAIHRRVQHVLRKAFSTGMKYVVVWELPTQTHLVVALAFSHYVYHSSVVHFSIQMTTGMSNLKLRQSCIQNIDASLHEKRNKKLTNLESLAMWWKPMWQSITINQLFILQVKTPMLTYASKLQVCTSIELF